MDKTEPDETRQVEDLRTISIKQERAIEALLEGKTQTMAAEMAGVSRQTLSVWFNQHPGFIATLNSRRLEMTQAESNRLLRLRARSMDVLEAALKESDRSVAQMILKLDYQTVSGPTDPDAVIELRATRHNNRLLTELSESANPFHDPAAPERVEEEMRQALANLEDT